MYGFTATKRSYSYEKILYSRDTYYCSLVKWAEFGGQINFIDWLVRVNFARKSLRIIRITISIYD